MDQPSGGIFINGKAQVLEMLEYMTQEERDRLIANIHQRNPQLAQELSEKSFKFNSIESMEDNVIAKLYQHVNPQILGMALKGTSSDFQRKVLTACPRNYAEAAFEALNTYFNNEASLIERAQNKITSVVLGLRKNNLF